MIRISVPFALLSLVASFALVASCKSPDALVELDVLGDASFENVNLTLTAAGVHKTYRGANFSPSKVFAVGLYLPSPAGGSVKVTALADNGVCAIGAGDTTVTGVSSGGAAAPVALVIHVMPCQAVPDGGTGV